MEGPKINISGKDIAIIAGLGIGAFIVYKVWKGISFNLSQSLPWWQNFFGMGSGPIPDVTGAAGELKEKQAFEAVVNNHSQGFYNASMQQYAYDNDMSTTLDAQGTEGWPWRSYQGWVSAGYPSLPGSDKVYADDHGVYHNEYV